MSNQQHYISPSIASAFIIITHRHTNASSYTTYLLLFFSVFIFPLVAIVSSIRKQSTVQRPGKTLSPIQKTLVIRWNTSKEQRTISEICSFDEACSIKYARRCKRINISKMYFSKCIFRDKAHRKCQYLLSVVNGSAYKKLTVDSSSGELTTSDGVDILYYWWFAGCARAHEILRVIGLPTITCSRSSRSIVSAPVVVQSDWYNCW